MRPAFIALVLSACSFSEAVPPPAPDAPSAMTPPTSTVIEWLGDALVQREGYALPADRVLAGAPVDICVQTYPALSAVRTTLQLSDQTMEMSPVRDDAGPFQHNRLWCAQLADLPEGSLALQLVAEDAGGAIRTLALPLTVARDVALFAAAPDLASWRMAGPGSFALTADRAAIAAQPIQDLGLYWAAIPTPADFDLALDWQLSRTDDNSGVFIRFRDPDTFGYDNPAWVGVHDGLEIQIDDTARPDGADVHRTGALYEQPATTYVRPSTSTPGVWRHFAISVRGERVTVLLDNQLVSDTTFGGDPQYPDRALPSASGAPRFIGLQTHTGAVAFRNVRLSLP